VQNNEIETLLIVGGGTAGWMCAAAIAKTMGPKVKITLVESDEIGIVGVGEATIPSVRLFNNLLGIDENEFLRETQGTFKLGIEFKNWRKKGHSYLHSFGNIGKDLAYVPFHHYWLESFLNGNKHDLWDYSFNTIAAYKNKFARLDVIPNSPLEGLVSAFHFDANLYAKYLRKYSVDRGVQRIEGKVTSVNLNELDGNIASIYLESGQELKSDFFIDCTGFRGLLIEGALKTGFEDYSNFLPVNRAMAVPCESSDRLLPYTRSCAHDAGWQWRIPLQHRIGNGHVYVSELISDDQAQDILMKNLDGKPLADPRIIKFTTGRRKKFWNKNCIAIGLSSGFLEPLESTAIHLIQSAIGKLINLFPHQGDNKYQSTEFNNQLCEEFDFIRDFIILHYYANERYGDKFWDQMRNMQLPSTLVQKIELFSETGNIFAHRNDLFQLPSWLQVMLGQGIMPKAFHPFVSTIAPNDKDQYLQNIRQIMENAAMQLPSHSDFIAKNCAAKKYDR
jgi:tryptophan 7-halogenase